MAYDIADFRIEKLIRRAPLAPLPLSDDDRAYVERHLDAVGLAFDIDVRPPPLTMLPARALVRHLGRLRETLVPDTFDRRLALGRLESVLRLVESAIALMERGGRRSA